jgi:hypothetical protein
MHTLSLGIKLYLGHKMKKLILIFLFLTGLVFLLNSFSVSAIDCPPCYTEEFLGTCTFTQGAVCPLGLDWGFCNQASATPPCSECVQNYVGLGDSFCASKYNNPYEVCHPSGYCFDICVSSPENPVCPHGCSDDSQCPNLYGEC